MWIWTLADASTCDHALDGQLSDVVDLRSFCFPTSLLHNFDTCPRPRYYCSQLWNFEIKHALIDLDTSMANNVNIL